MEERLLKARVACEDEGAVVTRRLGCRREAERTSLILNSSSFVFTSSSHETSLGLEAREGVDFEAETTKQKLFRKTKIGT